MAPSYLADNVAALRHLGVDPLIGLRAEPPVRYLLNDPDGAPRLRTADARSVRLESARDPAREADALVDAALAGGEAQTVAILGVGIGALLETVTRRGMRALVIEFDSELAAGWLGRRSWVAAIAANRLRLIVGPDYVGAAEAARFLEGVPRLPVIVHPVLAREYPEQMAVARRALDRVVRDALANANARERFEDLALVNSLRNLPAITASADVDSLFGGFTGTPAVVVGAGPSLDVNLEAIRDVQDRALVIAADTALLPCLKAGVVPQLVVALDPSAFNGRHLVACAAATETHLVTEPSVDPSGVDAFAGRAFAFRVGDHAPWPWLLDAGVRRGRLSVWGSVVTAALDVALRAGCPAIAFAGLDLAYTLGRPYARGTVFEAPWAWAIAEGGTLSEHWAIQLRNRAVVDEADVHGRRTTSAEHLLAFRDWIREVAAAHAEVRFANATDAGVLHGSHIIQQPLSEFARGLPVVGRGALASTVRDACTSSVDRTLRARLAAHLARARPLDITRGHSDAVRAAEAHVTGELLTRIARQLESPVSASTAGPMVISFSASSRIHLPEQTSLLQALTGGTANRLERADTIGAAARLRDAYRQLADLVGRAHGVRSSRDVADIFGWWHRVPARLLFEWPADMADAVETYGSTLADAIRLAGPSASRPQVESPLAGDSLQGESAIDRTRPSAEVPEDQLAAATLVWQWALTYALTMPEDSWLTRTTLRLLDTPPAMVPASRPADRLTVWLGDVADERRRVLFLPGMATIRAVSGLVAAEGAGTGRGPHTAELRLGLSVCDDGTLSPVCSIEPESLLARGHPRTHLVSTQSDGEALLGRSDGSGISVVSGSGDLVRVEAWPRPVRASILLGRHGQLAWHFPDAPRLLYRDFATGRVDVVEMPVGVFDAIARPDGGAYLATDAGLWAYTPGAGSAHRAVEGPWLVSLHAHGAGVRACARPARDEGGRWAATTEILEWQPGDAAFRVIAVPAGTAPFSVAERAGWRAEAWLDGCVVRLVRDDGRVFWLACSGPRSLAWAGPTLYVATVAGEVLRFPDVMTRLAGV
jgi:hypothetical protein